MKTWYSVGELAAIPGMPSGAWFRGRVRDGLLTTRPRLFGKGVEIDVACLPEEMRDRIASYPADIDGSSGLTQDHVWLLRAWDALNERQRQALRRLLDDNLPEELRSPS